MDLVDFLHARLNEDEKFALEAKGHAVTFDCSEESERHMYRWRTSRILTEVEAKRRIVALHTGHHECVSWRRHSTVLEPDAESPRTSTALVSRGYIHEDDPTLRLLASVYSDHPDYRPEWSPAN